MYKATGKNSGNLNSLRAGTVSTLKPSEIPIQSINANSISGSVPSLGPITFTYTGNFTFNGTPNSFADVITGTIFSFDIFVGGTPIRNETWSDGADLQSFFDFNYQMSLLSGNDVFEGSSTFAVADEAQGLGKVCRTPASAGVAFQKFIQ
jgi:hypothetical protein